jgi:hypothetical protein
MMIWLGNFGREEVGVKDGDELGEIEEEEM